MFSNNHGNIKDQYYLQPILRLCRFSICTGQKSQRMNKAYRTFSLSEAVLHLAKGTGILQSQKWISLNVAITSNFSVGWNANDAITVPLSDTQTSLPPWCVNTSLTNDAERQEFHRHMDGLRAGPRRELLLQDSRRRELQGMMDEMRCTMASVDVLAIHANTFRFAHRKRIFCDRHV